MPANMSFQDVVTVSQSLITEATANYSNATTEEERQRYLAQIRSLANALAYSANARLVPHRQEKVS